MAHPSPIDSVRLERLPPSGWIVVGVLLLSVLYSGLQIALVRPYLWPAGSGIQLEGDPSASFPLQARPPDLRRELDGPVPIARVAVGSPAGRRGLAPGDLVTRIGRPDASATIDFTASGTTVEGRLAAWRAQYWLGVSGPIEATVRSPSSRERAVIVERPPAWSTEARGWPGRHLGRIAQIVVFVGGAVVLFVLRGPDITAGVCALALALSGVAGGGPLLGAEDRVPGGAMLTVVSWMATPCAFPAIALAIMYFPSRSPLLARNPWLHAVPLAAAAPMIVPGLMTALYLAGLDAAAGLAAWDATHPGVYVGAFAAALAINLLAIVEGTYRYRINHDANERRRIRMALYTAVPGVAAFAIKDGLPVVSTLAGLAIPQYPAALHVLLQTVVLLPAFGLVYAVGVARVLGPRVVLRRSLQYALANRTLTVVGMLPAIALVLSVVAQRDRTISEIVRSSSGLFVALVAAAGVSWKYRDRARQWLDQRFFREEYDARKILLSLASRVRFETDPVDLANLVIAQLEEALHPQLAAVLVSGIDDGRLTPVAALHGRVESLPSDGGLAAMLRWSHDALEVYLDDPRSPARRLPEAERTWLESTGVVLLVPVLGEDRSLVAAIALGERRSEEAYTAEDLQLLASISTHMGLGFDVPRLARLRDAARTAPDGQVTTRLVVVRPMMECPRCGRCGDASLRVCPTDGSPMRSVSGVPRIVDNKYRIEQVLGQGGMGAVYRARDVRLDRLVALKVVRPELLGDAEARQRFRREAQIVARLQHPAIVAVYDYGTFADGGAYLVMELVRGEDLRRVLQREGRLDLDPALRILTSVCDAIEAAHREGVLHRDLKPENILLPGGSPGVKVLDFGVAKVVKDEPLEPALPPSDAPTLLTAAGTIVGTPAYMAPEQFQGGRVDTRTDVFSLGVIAYEMLSGELPFGRGSIGEVVLTQSRGAPPLHGVDVPAPVAKAIRMALDADPDRRPSSPHALAHLLASALRVG